MGGVAGCRFVFAKEGRDIKKTGRGRMPALTMETVISHRYFYVRVRRMVLQLWEYDISCTRYVV